MRLVLHHGASLHVEADPVLALHAVALPVGLRVPVRQTARPAARVLLNNKQQLASRTRARKRKRTRTRTHAHTLSVLLLY